MLCVVVIFIYINFPSLVRAELGCATEQKSTLDTRSLDWGLMGLFYVIFSVFTELLFGDDELCWM